MNNSSRCKTPTREALEALVRQLREQVREFETVQGESRYRELFERSADAILIIDDDTFVDCNQATVDMLRYRTKEELLQTHPSELSPDLQLDGRSSFEKANEMIAIAFERGSHRFEWYHKRADDSVFPVEVLLTPIARGGRDLLHVVWRDITDRKHLEQELRQAQKMEAMGKLTGGIAHDFNNLLVAVLGYAELLSLELPEQSPLREYVEQIRLAGDRAAGLVAQLLAFSRKQVMQPRVLDLHDILRNLEKMLVPLIGEDIRFVHHYHHAPLHIKVDEGQLEQVVVNLATNARDAMPEGGTLVLETHLVHLDEHSVGKKTNLEHGAYAVLSVADTGEGISTDNLARIFDPFFTTKDMEQGTGLGLSTVHGIVKQSGGDIVVHSEVGKGSIFKIYLPTTDEELRSEVDGPPGEGLAGRQATETILLVEDEAAVSGLVEEVLRREGYLVFVASNGLEALTLVDALDLKLDILLTDVIMPGMGGPELARHLVKMLPGLKVLYASGYTDSALVNRGALDKGVELIQKPFLPNVLLARLRRILDGNGNGVSDGPS